MSEPWYRDGLRFSCTRCGHCCTGEPGFVWVEDADLAAIGDYLDLPVAQLQAMYTRDTPRGRTLRDKRNGDCVFYDRVNGCTIYPVRPPQCQTWPFWESNVETPESWQQTCGHCPGSGQGELIPVEEITRRLKVIRL